MEVHTFGEKGKPVLVLLHAFGMHWSQWNNVADKLQNKYYIIIPSLEGHEDSNRTIFSSVEKNATDIIDWLVQNGYSNISGLIGISLGGAIAIKIVSMNQLKILYAVFDAGIVPLKKHGIKELGEVVSNLIMFYCAHSLTLMKVVSIPKIYGGLSNAKLLCSTMKSISFTTARNVFYGVDTYKLQSISVDGCLPKMEYWYGSLEQKEREVMALKLREIFPELKIRVFDGYRHAQLCLDKPGQYVSALETFIQCETFKNERT